MNQAEGGAHVNRNHQSSPARSEPEYHQKRAHALGKNRQHQRRPHADVQRIRKMLAHLRKIADFRKSMAPKQGQPEAYPQHQQPEVIAGREKTKPHKAVHGSYFRLSSELASTESRNGNPTNNAVAAA